MKNLLFFLLFISISGLSQNNIIPAVVNYEHGDGLFMLDQQTTLDVRSENLEVKRYAALFKSFLAGASINIKEGKVAEPTRSNKAIIVALNKAKDPEIGLEGYTLEVKENTIELMANAPSGIFNGFQTMRQLLPAQIENTGDGFMGMGMIMGCKIKDYPRFPWRGIMLDVSRHFFSVAEVKAYLDKMAQYKLNVFHWHLTDDEGWRIEIKSLPKLTEVGAWRVPRNGRFGKGRVSPEEGEEATEGGFYTQEQIKEVVQYAAQRNITIVPEIDMPGHSLAALAAYPELSVTQAPAYVNPGGYFADWVGSDFTMLLDNTLNPTDEKVYEFVDKVMTEVAELFPGKYIHMGGDECYHGYWEADKKVQKFMKKNKIMDTHELQSYFVGRVAKIIQSKGKKIIGWDEIMEGGPLENVGVMSWRNMDWGKKASNMGLETVMTPKLFTYLDYTQGDKSVENPIYSDLSLETAYSFDPIPEGADAKFILGGQGNLWTEVVPNLPFAMYMTYPRAFALAESYWSPKEKKDWNSFINRTEQHFQRFEQAQINISKAVYEAIIKVSKEDEKLMCELSNSVPNTKVFYTVDNTYPVNFGTEYTGPFEIPEGDLSLRTQTFRNGRPLGRELLIHRTDLLKRIR